MSFIESMDVPGFKVPSPNERVLKVISSPELGSQEDMTLLLSIISAGNTTGLHTHESTETMYVLSGRGVGTISGKTGEVKVDTVLVAPKGVLHEVRNTGDETLKLVCVYLPALKPSGNFEKAIDIAKQYFRTRKET